MLDQMLVTQAALSSCPEQSGIKNLYTRKLKGMKSKAPGPPAWVGGWVTTPQQHEGNIPVKSGYSHPGLPLLLPHLTLTFPCICPVIHLSREGGGEPIVS